MTATEKHYRQQLAQHHGPRGRGKRYPASLRAAALELLRTRREQGAKLAAVAQELGLRTATLTRWAKQPAKRPSTAPAFQPVRVVERPAGVDPACGRTVLGPAGLRIEGLTVATLAVLLRSLA